MDPNAVEPTTTTDETTLREAGHRDASVLKTAGQRRINLLWETTQAIIALGVTAATIFASLTGKDSRMLENAFVLIIGIYFVRMNHTKTGGVGVDDDSR